MSGVFCWFGWIRRLFPIVDVPTKAQLLHHTWSSVLRTMQLNFFLIKFFVLFEFGVLGVVAGLLRYLNRRTKYSGSKAGCTSIIHTRPFHIPMKFKNYRHNSNIVEVQNNKQKAFWFTFWWQWWWCKVSQSDNFTIQPDFINVKMRSSKMIQTPSYNFEKRFRQHIWLTDRFFTNALNFEWFPTYSCMPTYSSFPFLVKFNSFSSQQQ